MNKAATTRLDADSAGLQRAKDAVAEANRILKEVARDRKRHPVRGRGKISIVDEIKAILGIR